MKNMFLILASALLIVACSDNNNNTSTPETTSKTNTPSSSNQTNTTKQKSGATIQVETADSIYHHGKVYTVDANNNWAEAIAVSDGKIVAVGSNDEVLKLAGATTKMVDLGGRMLMPGIHDTHIHPADAGISRTLECSFLSNDLNEVLDILKGCIAEAAPGEWIRGGQWNEGYFVNNPKKPKEILDEIAPDNPVFLMDWSVHHAWVNSDALDRFNIDDDTPDPVGGVINRDQVTGEATGLLYDNAAYNKRHELPAYSLEEETSALLWSINEIKQYGITTIKDAIVTDSNMAAYHELATSSQLPIRVKTNLTWKSAWAKSHQHEKDLIAKRDEFKHEMIDTDFVKIMLDGVPMTYTSALIEPYEPNDVVGPDHRGKLMIPADQLIKDVIELDKQGLSVKIHATGDGSARAALDAFEAAREANGPQDVIHEVSHAEMIHPDDVARFKELNVVAEMCPIIWYPIPGLTWEAWFGDRIPQWQVKTLYDSGAIVSYGSDWPVVPTANPWPGIEAMVTRSDPYQTELKTEFVEEAVDLATALRIFTHNSAIANKVGDSSGSIEVGKDADFIVLDQNLFEVDIMVVGDTKVLMSVVGGNPVVNELSINEATNTKSTTPVAAAAGVTSAITMSDSESAVRSVVESYIEGTKNGDVELLKTVFHPKARMVGYMGRDLLSAGPEPFYSALTENPPDDMMRANYEPKIRDIEVNGNIAIATLDEKGLFGENFTNHFMLLNDNNKWSITHKSFVVHQSENNTMSSDEAGVRSAIQNYVEGTANGDIQRVRSAFHADSGMIGFMGPDLLSDGPEPYYEFLQQNPATNESIASYSSNLKNLEVNDSIARATLLEDGFFGMDFVTHLTLIKTDGQWTISNKTFHVNS